MIPLAPRYVPVAIYTFGLFYGWRREPYETIVVAADSKDEASKKAFKLLPPNLVQRLSYIKTRPNPDHIAEQARYAEAHDVAP